MNNKKLGTDFEKYMCEAFASRGYWVHFIAPDTRGAQPFDVIAAKDGRTYVFDCKTTVNPVFGMTRLEDNQVMAFEKWIRCGNSMPYVMVLWNSNVYMLPYMRLKSNGKIDLRKEEPAKWLTCAEE